MNINKLFIHTEKQKHSLRIKISFLLVNPSNKLTMINLVTVANLNITIKTLTSKSKAYLICVVRSYTSLLMCCPRNHKIIYINYSCIETNSDENLIHVQMCVDYPLCVKIH